MKHGSSHPLPLIPGVIYHIYNRGNNVENIFNETRNYDYFLKLYTNYIDPIAETLAYCLLRNHFHFLIYIRDKPVLDDKGNVIEPSKAFADFFSTYTKAFNKAYERTGSLFQKPFKRKPVENDRHYAALVSYIHRNPQMHGFVDDFREWAFSSYQAIITTRSTKIAREQTLDWFGSRQEFIRFHAHEPDPKMIGELIDNDP